MTYKVKISIQTVYIEWDCLDSTEVAALMNLFDEEPRVMDIGGRSTKIVVEISANHE